MNLTLYRGESRTLRLTVTEEDSSARVDLTGATIEFEVKAKEGASDPALLAKTLAGGGITLLDQGALETRGQFEITIAPADTATMAAKTYRYDVVVAIGPRRQCVVPPSNFELRTPVNGP